MRKLSLVVCVLLAGGIAARSQSPVQISERPLVIPTYQVAPPDKNPIFYTGRTYQGARGEIYPHPMYDVLTDQKTDQTYRAVFLENEFTELCVMPELGGRILSALDKTDQFDYVYRQHVIKPALIGMIGAWISGGVEWNIPDHHRATSQLPVDYTMENNPDGSKTVWVGETELSRKLKWRVGLTVYPGRSYIEATVKVMNTTPFIQPMLYWANLSVHCDENYQVIFPPSTQFGVQHAKGEFTSWPIGSGYYGGVDRKGTDLSWWKNHPNPASIFTWNFQDDFLAGYDHKKEAGTVHIANHQQVGGKKFFLWGNNPESKMWEKMLTDADGQYLELMTGAYSDNQPDYSWIGPGETRVFKQFWYPIRKIGGVKNANTDAALNLERLSPKAIRVGLNTTANFKATRLLVTVGNKKLTEVRLDIGPATPYIKEFSVDAGTADTSIRVQLFSAEGKELISYQPEQLIPQPMPKPIETPRAPATYGSNEELYLTGLRLEQFRNASIDPKPYYEEALRRDSLDYRVNNVLGIRASQDGKLSEASNYLERAIRRQTKNYTIPRDGESYYYLGIVRQLQNRFAEAKDFFWKASWYTGYKSIACYRLAQIAAMDKDYSKSMELVNQAIVGNANYTDAITLKAFLCRKTGKSDEAGNLIAGNLAFDPLNHWAATEKYFSNAGAKSTTWTAADQKDYKIRCGSNVQTVLELSLQYAAVGAYEEALQVLSAYQSLKESNSEFPLLYYYQGFYLSRLSRKNDAVAAFAKGKAASSDYCFPSRVEEMEILAEALKQNPSDAKAYYYLGNLYYFLNQKENARMAWEHATKADESFALAFRNLGFSYGQDSALLKKAIVAYEKATALDHSDARLFTELDILREQAGIPAKDRLQTLQQNLATVEKRDDAITRLIELYNITGQYEKAIAILKNRHFHVWEGGGNIHQTYVDAYLLNGIAQMKNNQYEAAIADFNEALKYPENLEVGEPYWSDRNSEINYFIAQAYAGLKNEEQAKVYYQKILNDRHYGNYGKSGFYRALAMQKMAKDAESRDYLDKLETNSQKLLKEGDSPDFFSKFGSASSREAKMSENYMMLGLAYLGKGEQDRANQQFTRAMELNQNNIWARVFLNMKTL
jgi:tetratricopeptide (TPR) repeat protein